MKKNMDCLNFKAPQEMAKFMSEVLSELQHSSPYNSYVDAFVKKEFESYDVIITIKFGDGEFSSKAHNVDLEKAVKETSNEIVIQIQDWHKSRFEQ
jgi:hypothetical protein